MSSVIKLHLKFCNNIYKLDLGELTESEKIDAKSPVPSDKSPIVLPTAATVSKRPQNVPKRPRNMSTPIRYRERSLLSSSRE